MKSLIPFLFTAFVFASPGFTQDEPEADPAELPRIPATEPEDALSPSKYVPDSPSELAAAEPLVVDPIDIDFDEHGRMFVVEMRGYSEHREDALGRIKLLIDENDDGIFDKASVYAEGLKWPTSVCCYDGGVFVTASPDIFYFKDTDGDGVSDQSETVFTGFGQGLDRLNMQALVNSLTWGPDNRIWGATARNGGNVRRPDKPESEAINLRGADFSFDPKTRELRAENGTAQFGMSFDSAGRRFVCSNSDHIQWVAWERSWVKENPFHSMPPPLVSIAADGAAAPVFRISPDEPWRIVRTRWRVSGVVRGAVEGGGRVSGYFTAATGITIYTGDAFDRDRDPLDLDSYRGSAFIGDAGSNLVHRKVLSQFGDLSGGIIWNRLQPVANRGPGESESEFIASRDNWFRPVNFSNGPDGCLYICDMYRETIEHPWSIPEGIKKYVDLDSGNDRGRIWRVKRADHRHQPTLDLSEISDNELVSVTRDSQQGGWTRDTARRLLWQRGKWREEYRFSNESHRNLAGELPHGRFLRELSLAESDSPEKIEELAELSRIAGNDEWQLAAIANAVRTPKDAIALSDASPSFKLKTTLAEMLGRMNDKKSIAQFIKSSATALREGNSDQFALIKNLTALAEGTARSGSKLSDFISNREILIPFQEAALKMAGDSSQGKDNRITGIAFLAISSDSNNQVDETLRDLLKKNDNPAEVQQAALEALKTRNADDLPIFLVESWEGLSPTLRSSAFGLIAGNAKRIEPLLDAAENGSFRKEWLSIDQAEILRSHKDTAIRERATKLFPAPEIVDREEIVKRYQPALKLKGDPQRGKVAFAKGACITCHKATDGQGVAVGPDVATFKTAGADSILKNVFDPNAEVAPQYQAFAFDLHDGESVVGIIAREDATEVMVRMPGGLEKTFPRKDVAAMKGLGRSLMPEGIEAALNEQEVADLLAYLTENP